MNARLTPWTDYVKCSGTLSYKRRRKTVKENEKKIQ